MTATQWVDKNLGPLFNRAFGMAESAARSLTAYISTTMYPWLVDKWNDAKPTLEAIWATVQTAFSKAEDIAKSPLSPLLRQYGTGYKTTYCQRRRMLHRHSITTCFLLLVVISLPQRYGVLQRLSVE